MLSTIWCNDNSIKIEEGGTNYGISTTTNLYH
ncbi:Uncharacterised protein [[Eubacterium] contortum]|uniref:Uncharacterized protein n=1 Tax=Faecalicatena contorta TaxID=39482 RepID=A0A174CKM9_9FIRM|nr:Uncharacterised protein [[Eubacterium] contortum] [Faecalicatena contorta]